MVVKSDQNRDFKTVADQLTAERKKRLQSAGWKGDYSVIFLNFRFVR